MHARPVVINVTLSIHTTSLLILICMRMMSPFSQIHLFVVYMETIMVWFKKTCTLKSIFKGVCLKGVNKWPKCINSFYTSDMPKKKKYLPFEYASVSHWLTTDSPTLNPCHCSSRCCCGGQDRSNQIGTFSLGNSVYSFRENLIVCCLQLSLDLV